MGIADVINELSSAARRELAKSLFSGYHEEGLSANQALKSLQEQGLGYRRTDFLADYRSSEGEYNQAIAIRSVRGSNTPSDRILEPKYFGTPDKYSLVFKASGNDQFTGEESNQYFFYHRNALDTRSNMEQDALDWLSNQSDKYGMSVASVSIVEGYINPLWT